jgi:hypothetical protein
VVGGVLLALAAGWAILHAYRATAAGLAGRSALIRAENAIGARRLADADTALAQAEASFSRMRREIDRGGPLLPVARLTPFLRAQVKGAEAFADAGRLIADAGQELVVGARAVLEPAGDVAVSDAVEILRSVHTSVRAGRASLDRATASVATLDGYRLVGPLGSAPRQLAVRLREINADVAAADEGLGALVEFIGGRGPRRYLVFSQNPDEPRPTGGYMGSYGVLAAEGGHLSLERYDGIEQWGPRGEVVVPNAEAPSPFRLQPTLPGQAISNANATPDWPTAARLALELWQRGGEQPVDGVLSVLPAFLARVLAVTGPVAIPSYGETVTAANVIERLDYHTHVAPADPTDSKEFVAVVAEAVIGRLLETPADRWADLASAIGAAFDAREAMVWSRDIEVQRVVAARRWDGTLPQVFGDFFYNGEFAYAAKNGRSLKRTFDHRVEVREDGSARITTTITIANPTAFDREYNQSSLTYLTVYGPQGAQLNPASDPPASLEPAVSGHPAAGWFLAAPPGGETRVRVVWDAPAILKEIDGRLYYGLWWMRVPDHTGDVLNLAVTLPEGWRWDGTPPPPSVQLERDVVGTWAIRATDSSGLALRPG